MEATAKKLINAAGSKTAAWTLYRAYWALSNDEAALVPMCSALGQAFEAKYSK
jgi:hypothetical protein